MKRASNSTFAILDAYRHMFLIKHPSRRDIIGEARRVLAILYSLMGGGVAWESVQNIEAALLRAATQAHLDAEQAAEVEVERSDRAYIRFCKVRRIDAVVEAHTNAGSAADCGRRSRPNGGIRRN